MPANQGRRPTDRQQSQHEQNRELLNEIASDVRSLRERYTDNISEVNKKLDLIFDKLAEAADVATALALLESRVKTLEDARTSTARVLWGLVTVAFGTVAEVLWRSSSK